MVSVGVMVAIIGGSVGVYFGFVDGGKPLFALGTAVMALGVLAAFAGWTPPALRLGRPRVTEGITTLAYLTAALALFAAGSVGILYGFTDDWEWAFLLGLAAWAGSVYLMFGGRLGAPSRRPRLGNLATPMYLTGAMAAMLAGAAGVYYGLVEDIEYLFLLGLAGWAAAVVTTFRGTLAR